MSQSTDLCFFVSDLHGRLDRYGTLLQTIVSRQPGFVFIGGDLLPSGMASLAHNVRHTPFVDLYLIPEFERLRETMPDRYPRIFVILGNDDGRFEEDAILAGQKLGLWEYAHDRAIDLGSFTLFGYNYIPPTPFLLKDWERYDVSRYVDPGCVSPEEGQHSRGFDPEIVRHSTIKRDLKALIAERDLSRSLFLFHTPPYQTALDWVDHNGRLIDGVEPDRHIGSIAVRRMIEAQQPLLTLHGHAHESARLSGSWRDRIGETILVGGAHDGQELALIRFRLSDPSECIRELL